MLMLQLSYMEFCSIPATIAILGGVIHVGLSTVALERLAMNSMPKDQRRPIPGHYDLAAVQQPVHKVSIRDFSWVMASKGFGATTVAGTCSLVLRLLSTCHYLISLRPLPAFVAGLVGIDVFATGGIGGVHREGHVTMDISADLTTLAQTPIAVVCAGAKSILDLPRTLEYLETVGVNVVGYQTQEFPAFFTRRSGLQLQSQADSPQQLASILYTSQQLGVPSGMLVCVPIGTADEADGQVVEAAITTALQEADTKHILGKDITPFLLSRISQLTHGLSLKSNISLLKQNAKVAAQMAAELAALKRSTYSQLTTTAKPSTAVSSTFKTPPSITGTANKSTKLEVLVFGAAAVDIVARPHANPHGSNRQYAERTDGESLAGTVTMKAGGVGRNIAEALGAFDPNLGVLPPPELPTHLCGLYSSTGSWN